MGVSKNRGTPKSSILIGFYHYKPSILGYPYFWKYPNVRGPADLCYHFVFATLQVNERFWSFEDIQDGYGDVCNQRPWWRVTWANFPVGLLGFLSEKNNNNLPKLASWHDDVVMSCAIIISSWSSPSIDWSISMALNSKKQRSQSHYATSQELPLTAEAERLGPQQLESQRTMESWGRWMMCGVRRRFWARTPLRAPNHPCIISQPRSG